MAKGNASPFISTKYNLVYIIRNPGFLFSIFLQLFFIFCNETSFSDKVYVRIYVRTYL